MQEISLNQETFEIALEKEGELSAKKRPLILYFPNEENALEAFSLSCFPIKMKELWLNTQSSVLGEQAHCMG